jgi:OTU domain-containing protein 6
LESGVVDKTTLTAKDGCLVQDDIWCSLPRRRISPEPNHLQHPTTPPYEIHSLATADTQSLPPSLAPYVTMSDTAPEPETLEALQARHRKEQRDLVSRTTQKKKQASKKTRKGVNDECERLEWELKERQEKELAALNGDAPVDGAEVAAEDEDEPQEEDTLEAEVAKLHMNGSSAQSQDGSTVGEDNDTGAGGRKKKPNRAKARLARRAAEQDAVIREAEREAANAPNPREIERERMETQLAKHKLALHEIRANGHCLYAAVADQLHTRELGTKPKIEVTVITEELPKAESYKKVRYAAADWIEGNADDFAAFLEDPLPEHVRKIRDTGEWGGHPELIALARTYGVRICVLHSDGRVDKIEPEEAAKDVEEIWLGYYKHSHGLGEHYNSLRKAG